MAGATGTKLVDQDTSGTDAVAAVAIGVSAVLFALSIAALFELVTISGPVGGVPTVTLLGGLLVLLGGGVMSFGVGRAIGETMAATVMLRGVPRLTEPLVNVFYGQETLTSIIARNYGEADGLQMDALFVAGVILFVTVLVISIGAQYIEWRMHKRLGGEV